MNAAKGHTPTSCSGHLTGVIDNNLARISPSRRTVLAVPQFAGLCTLIEGSSQLRADDPPFDLNLSELSMVWNGVNDNDPAERWLRSKIVRHMSAPPPAH
jgi:LysR family transcriptional activator of mexEF-oprN operon